MICELSDSGECIAKFADACWCREVEAARKRGEARFQKEWANRHLRERPKIGVAQIEEQKDQDEERKGTYR